MKTSINLVITKEEVDKLFIDLAKRRAQEMLLHPDSFECSIVVEGSSDLSSFKAVNIRFTSNDI
jgi:hypothetical protein